MGLLLALLVFGLAACAGATRGTGATRAAGSLGWEDFTLGMSVDDAGRRADGSLDLRRIEDRCGESGARVVHGERELFLGFTAGDGPTVTLHTIVVRLRPDATKEEVVRDLKARFPRLRYSPDPRWPAMGEEENPKPLYVHPELPEQGIRVDVEEGWMWISYLRCLD